MTRPLAPTDVRCKDGKLFSVARKCGSITVFATFRDGKVVSSGLGRFMTFHEPGDEAAEHQGMPVEIVRSYARAHGGVAEAGEEALALLKALPSQADPIMGEPPPDSQPAAVEEAAAESPLPEARGAVLAGRASASAAPRASDRADMGGSPSLRIDQLTPAVIAARQVVAAGAPIGPDKYAAIAALVVVTDDRYSAHPLLAEGERLRDLLCGRVRDQA